jgi:DNA invertase Pin-like site-specific DNA recombinase
MVAQMERQFIKERQKAGIEAAKTRGVYKGGKAKIDLVKVGKLKAEGQTMAAIAAHFGVTRQGVYKALKDAGGD